MRTSLAGRRALAALGFFPSPAIARLPAAEAAAQTGLHATASRCDGAVIDYIPGGSNAAVQARDAHGRTPGPPSAEIRAAAPSG